MVLTVPEEVRKRKLSKISKVTSKTEHKSVKFVDSISDDSDSEKDTKREKNNGDDNSEEEEEEDEGFINENYAYPESSRTEEESDSAEQIAHVTLSPNEDEIKDGLFSVLSGFEHTVGQVVSLLKNPKLKPFYMPPKYDLTSQYEEEKKREEEEGVVEPSWPNTDLVFGLDPDYQHTITGIIECVESNLNNIISYSVQFDAYTDMVEQARHVKVGESMEKREWTTDDFYNVLSIHTDQEREMLAMERMRRIGFIQVESEGFCNNCLPFPRTVIRDVVSRLPGIACKRNEDLLRIIKVIFWVMLNTVKILICAFLK